MIMYPIPKKIKAPNTASVLIALRSAYGSEPSAQKSEVLGVKEVLFAAFLALPSPICPSYLEVLVVCQFPEIAYKRQRQKCIIL
ncbi:hypothetical protein CEXT_129641 [Caerostris extrusa]|uniref:Uncharacterized protein n=1 Tax=Caerostris extrusa TaxID=172846 RepID=A0AAV4N4A1_CAEEX|nr:hypothetical protein CEXT_129641 [Caerostris extrusa]